VTGSIEKRSSDSAACAALPVSTCTRSASVVVVTPCHSECFLLDESAEARSQSSHTSSTTNCLRINRN
jgi:hypothetical protein